jgi:hypothetical protein
MLGAAVAAGQFMQPSAQGAPAAPQAPAAVAPAVPVPTPPTPAAAGGTDPAGKDTGPVDLEGEVAKWKALARKHETQHIGALGFKSKDELDQLRTAAQKYQEFEEQQKTELQRATDKATTYEQQLADAKAANSRLMAAATHSIPPDLIDLLGGGTAEEIGARAEALATHLKAVAPAAAAPAAQRPVESLTPGAAPASAAPVTADDWIRNAAGRRP